MLVMLIENNFFFFVDRNSTQLKAVEITIEFLDLDFDVGDYMMIGGGSSPLMRSMSTARLFTEYIKNKKIWVNADGAYIRIVTYNSLKKTGKAMRFHWSPLTADPSDVIEQPKISQRLTEVALHICLNIHCKDRTPQLNKIIKKYIAFQSNQYFMDHKSQTNFVSEDNVLFLGVSTKNNSLIF